MEYILCVRRRPRTISGARLDPFIYHPHDSVGHKYVLSEAFLLKQLERPQCRSRIVEVYDVLRPAEILKIVKIGDEVRIVKKFLASQMVEIPRIGEALDELR